MEKQTLIILVFIVCLSLALALGLGLGLGLGLKGYNHKDLSFYTVTSNTNILVTKNPDGTFSMTIPLLNLSQTTYEITEKDIKCIWFN